MRFPSRKLAGLVLAVLFALPLPALFAAVERADVMFVERDEVRTEDVYALANRVIVEGTIEGDLVAATGDLTIAGSGRVTGDVIAVVAGTVRINGAVEGSVRTAAVNISVGGAIGEDLWAFGIDVAVDGEVGRDVLVTGGSLAVDGGVGRDAFGQILVASLDGEVGHDVDVMVQSFEVGPSARVDGDLTYRAPGDARVSAGAVVGGQFARIDLQFPFVVAVILRVATIVGFLGFILLGILAFWLLRATTPRAAAMVRLRPLPTVLAGIAVLLGLPMLTVVLGLTLVGIPAALVVLLAFVVALVAGPVPAVTAFGERLVRGRAGIVAAFVVGAIVWRGAIWLIPWIGFALYLLALVWGLGGWFLGAWEVRRERTALGAVLIAPPAPSEPASPAADEDWEPPLPPDGDGPGEDVPPAG